MTMLTAPLLVGSAAFAQQKQTNSPGVGAGGSQMNMTQMMEHCRQMQGMDRSKMQPDMKQMATQCDQMMRAHQGQTGDTDRSKKR